MEFKDYYKILGVEPNASIDEIKKVYRKMARKYHPDVSKEADAEQKFKEISEAWEALKDPEKRKVYDEIRQGGYHAGQQYRPEGAARSQHYSRDMDMGEFSEFFSSIFGGQDTSFHGFHSGTQRKQKGRDVHSKIQVPLNIAYHGGKQTIQFALQPGQKNSVLNITIPKGTSTGSHMRLKGQGMPGMYGGVSGDLYLEIEVLPYAGFTLVNQDIHINLPITPWEAALGATITAPTLDGKVNVKIAQGARTGQKLRLKGKGLPGAMAGDQIMMLQIQTPAPKNAEEKALYETMAQTMNFNPRSEMEI